MFNLKTSWKFRHNQGKMFHAFRQERLFFFFRHVSKGGLCVIQFAVERRAHRNFVIIKKKFHSLRFISFIFRNNRQKCSGIFQTPESTGKLWILHAAHTHRTWDNSISRIPATWSQQRKSIDLGPVAGGRERDKRCEKGKIKLPDNFRRRRRFMSVTFCDPMRHASEKSLSLSVNRIKFKYQQSRRQQQNTGAQHGTADKIDNFLFWLR